MRRRPMGEITDADRWQWCLRNPGPANSLFRLLEKGVKGDAKDLTRLVDQVLTAERTTGRRYEFDGSITRTAGPCEPAKEKEADGEL